MKLLAFVDIHGSPSALKRIEKIAKQEKPDCLVCGGDITIFEQHIEQILGKLDSVAESIGKKLFIVSGNHESDEMMQVVCKHLKNVIFAHKKLSKIEGFDDYVVTGFGGGGFSLVVCGHLHENARKQDKIGKTLIINPGAVGAIVELK